MGAASEAGGRPGRVVSWSQVDEVFQEAGWDPLNQMLLVGQRGPGPHRPLGLAPEIPGDCAEGRLRECTASLGLFHYP